MEDPQDLFAAPARGTPQAERHLPLIRGAIKASEVLAVTYLEADGSEMHGDIHPLRLDRQGQVVALEARIPGKDLRRFRLDRILALDGTGEFFGTPSPSVPAPEGAADR